MFENSAERIKWLKKGMLLPVIEQIYIETNSLKVIKSNILKNS